MKGTKIMSKLKSKVAPTSLQGINERLEDVEEQLSSLLEVSNKKEFLIDKIRCPSCGVLIVPAELEEEDDEDHDVRYRSTTTLVLGCSITGTMQTIMIEKAGR